MYSVGLRDRKGERALWQMLNFGVVNKYLILNIEEQV